MVRLAEEAWLAVARDDNGFGPNKNLGLLEGDPPPPLSALMNSLEWWKAASCVSPRPSTSALKPRCDASTP